MYSCVLNGCFCVLCRSNFWPTRAPMVPPTAVSVEQGAFRNPIQPVAGAMFVQSKGEKRSEAYQDEIASKKGSDSYRVGCAERTTFDGLDDGIFGFALPF